MRLIDADRFDRELEINNFLKDGESDAEFVDRIRKVIEDQPTVFPVFAGRTNGKQAIMTYVDMCRVLDNFGIDSIDPVSSLRFVLEQYQRIVCELTNGFFSKLTYDADVVISKVIEKFEEDTEQDNENIGR